MSPSSWSPNVLGDRAAAFDVDTDRADASVVEVTLLWGDSTLAVRHLAAGETVTVGDGEDCDLMMAGASASEPIRIEHGAAGVHVLPGTGNGSLTVDGHAREAAPFELALGHRAEIVRDAFTLRLRVIAAGKVAPLTIGERVRQASFGAVAVSFAVHASLVASLAYFLPSLGQDDSEAIDRDRLYAMKAMMDTIAEKEPQRQEALADEAFEKNAGAESGGQRAKDEEGAMGTTTARSHGHYAAKGTAKPNEVTLSREALVEAAKNFGMIELLGTIPMASAADGPTVPWGTVQNGMHDRNHRGDLWSNEFGDAFGTGLLLSGTGQGGGGPGEGIGINDFGGLGNSLASRIGGTCMTPPCDGMGSSSALRTRGHVSKGPIMRAEKTEIDGKLPAEVIQRIVRMSHGRFRHCYEGGLRSNPSLGGRVAVRFIIGRDGSVTHAIDGGSDLPDQAVRQCVVQAFFPLSFPAPQGGTVRVTYPLAFSPSE